MKQHRFYIDPKNTLTSNFLMSDKVLLHQWIKVLRFKPGQELVLFDGHNNDNLYKITSLTNLKARLNLVRKFEPNLPSKNIYLMWSVLKKDKNDWVLQKCTELGVKHFVPILTARTEKTGFDLERAKRIIVEAAEQCGRSDIPAIHEPVLLDSALKTYHRIVPIIVCQQGENGQNASDVASMGVLVGPEGGWTSDELSAFKQYNLPTLSLHNFTLRSETAAITAVLKLLQ